MQQVAPVIVFVYDRPDHARQTLEALSRNKLAALTQLYIFADGPKADAPPEQLEKIAATRSAIREKQWCGQVEIIERDTNTGLGPSVVAGVTEVVNQHGRVIVLEDDIVTSPGFLTFMNEALDFYADKEKVMHISAYMYPLEKPLPDTLFYNVTTCWGWATWKRAWQHFIDDAEEILKELDDKGLTEAFDRRGRKAFTDQLRQIALGMKQTWAVKWQASVFLQEGLCLHPGRSLVQNIGHDGSGEHCYETDHFKHDHLEDNLHIRHIPLEESQEARALINQFYKKQEPGLLQKVRGKISSVTPEAIKKLLRD